MIQLFKDVKIDWLGETPDLHRDFRDADALRSGFRHVP